MPVLTSYKGYSARPLTGAKTGVLSHDFHLSKFELQWMRSINFMHSNLILRTGNRFKF